MKKLTQISLSLILAATLANAAPYTIDKVHTDVSFKVTHLSISKVRGNFGSFDATIDFDKASNEVKAFDATIDAKSINTQNAKRDDHLRSADFFEADKFEKLSFKMTKYVKESDNEGKIHGDLMIRGITKPVVFDFELGGFHKTDKGEKIGFSLETDINRKDFGVGKDSSNLTISDKVSIQIEAEADSK
ncbi:YceI family protein [Campylobacter suis]|uniref:Protein YceI n=1 Tax=Campylobacter suis TaxID=2790657 RepID=A0ABN7K3M1_9BACT|nr:YceI family protein [Campylobacter suis]CAD7287119.1 Protein YceI [Campylobacter suis]